MSGFGSTTMLLAAALALAGLTGCGGGGGRPTGGPVPIPDTIRRIAGRITYMTTGPSFNGRLPDGRMPVARGFILSGSGARAPGFPVEVRRPDGSLLATGVTNSNGDYSISVNFGQNPATQVSITTEARLDIPGTVARVYEDESSLLPYRHSSVVGGTPTDPVMTINLSIEREEGAAAYHILASISDGYFAGHRGVGSFPELDIYWKPGNGAESSFRDEGGRGKLLVAGGITGDLASNTDCWDAPMLMRLFGLYLQRYFYLERAPAGTPSDALLVPSSAWREGFLDWWACQGRGSRIFWDTEGLGAEGRIVRYFDIESFFSPTLGSLGPEDPNVYQEDSVVGIGSRFSVAEMLWDIHDTDGAGTDSDAVEFPVDLTFGFMAEPRAGFHYPYLFTLFDRYTSDGSLDPVRIDLLTRFPEAQGMSYPATPQNGLRWPVQFSPDTQPGGGVRPPFTKTHSDVVDTLSPVPLNTEIGLLSQRYYLIDLVTVSNLTATLTTAGDLVVDICDLNNVVIASGPSPLTAMNLPTLRFLIRVRSAGPAQISPFDLRVDVSAP